MKAITLITLLFPAALALADGNKIFDALDKDGNGALSPAEVATETALSAAFEKYDSNGDGQLSRTEFAAYLNQ